MAENNNCPDCLYKALPTKNLNKNELAALQQNSVEVVFDKKDTIFKQDALSSNIIYLKTGMVKLIIRGPQREQILKLKKAPCYLGLPTTMGDKINHYSAVALEKTTACFIDYNIFKDLLDTNKDFSHAIILELCKSELDQFNRYVNMVQINVYGRLAKNLLTFSDEIYHSDEFVLPLNHHEIADLVYTSRETVSRFFSDLTNEKIIQTQDKHIHILNKSMLKEISDKG
ncbi:hypothetical protein MNBD_BACTEROID07-662 [hydrothermal vent metagenome]|uniref:Transcriptional regulator, Crp/Fnr family n=1 Tax=hydrothermal vent metagenome TaxID=652676 RepID=A0A3B0UP39_9ZZZZ